MAGELVYEALVGHIRRESDGLLHVLWGLADADTRQPVTSGKPGPWTRTDAQGGRWVHIGRNADVAEVLLWDSLDDAEAYARQAGATAFHVAGMRTTFKR